MSMRAKDHKADEFAPPLYAVMLVVVLAAWLLALAVSGYAIFMLE